MRIFCYEQCPHCSLASGTCFTRKILSDLSAAVSTKRYGLRPAPRPSPHREIWEHVTAPQRCHVTHTPRACRSQTASGRMGHRGSVVVVLSLTVYLGLCLSSHAYVLDDIAGLGRVFDGVGGLSGGGVSAACFPSTFRVPQEGQQLECV